MRNQNVIGEIGILVVIGVIGDFKCDQACENP